MSELSRLLQNDIIGKAVDQLLEEADQTVPKEDRLLFAWMDGLVTAACIGPVEVSLDDLMRRLPVDFDNSEPGVAGAMRSMLDFRRGQLRLEIGELKEDFEPNFPDTAESAEEELEFAREWANGFRTGMNVEPGAWHAVVASHETLHHFAAIAVLMLEPKDGEDPEKLDNQCREAIPDIGEAVWRLRQFWRQQAPKKSKGRELAKLGRNSICLCGSGKKFKRCHGA